MAKKHFGRFVVLAAISGAAAASISYFLRYRSFHKELDEEFHDFEDDFDDALEYEGTDSEKPQERSYVPLNTEHRQEVKTGQGEAKLYRSGADAVSADKTSDKNADKTNIKSTDKTDVKNTNKTDVKNTDKADVKEAVDGAATITEDTAI